MKSQFWRWVLGVFYTVIVATIWITASFVVQSVVDSGVSPFLITYICNSLFMVYIPIAEIARYVEDSVGNLWFWPGRKKSSFARTTKELEDSEEVVLLGDNDSGLREEDSVASGSRRETRQKLEFEFEETERELPVESGSLVVIGVSKVSEGGNGELDAKGRWTRARTAKVSLLICPFWFLAQLTFNLSLKYTTVTSNTILSSTSSLFTFLAALVFLGEKFMWVKLVGVLLCMGGTIIVSIGDSTSGSSSVAPNPLLGDILALVSTSFYAVYVTLIRKKLPDDENEEVGKSSMTEFLGYLGLFNLLIFLPVALLLNFTKLEPFHALSWKQVGLIVGKGLLDNVLSDYLWAKAVLLTSTTVATAGLTMQVPLAAVVDSIKGHPPHFMDYLGAVSVVVGFVGINAPSDVCCSSKDADFVDREQENVIMTGEDQNIPIGREITFS